MLTLARLVRFSGAVLATVAIAQSQTRTITYDLVNVMLTPDITSPGSTLQVPLTGTFEWTYTLGDFENGTGQFVSYSVPWWSGAAPPLGALPEVDQIEWWMPGNFHNFGCDVQLKPVADLLPFQPVALDTTNSTFDIEVNGLQRRGHAVSGSIVPRCPLPVSYGSGTAGTGGIEPQLDAQGGDPLFGNQSFAIAASDLRGGTAVLFGVSGAETIASAFGVSVWIDPVVAVLVPAVASGVPGQAGGGQATLPLPIPSNPALVGSEHFVQAFTVDPNGPAGFLAASAGLRLTICQ